MLKTINGNLLESDCDVIIQQANCFATMGAGIAKQIVAKYPGVLTVDRNFAIKIGSSDRLGHFSSYFDQKDNVEIINMYSQHHYGRGQNQTDYDAMRNALARIAKSVKPDQKIGLPFGIGCGLAGGDWTTVKYLLQDFSKEIGRDVFVYKFTPPRR